MIRSWDPRQASILSVWFSESPFSSHFIHFPLRNADIGTEDLHSPPADSLWFLSYHALGLDTRVQLYLSVFFFEVNLLLLMPSFGLALPFKGSPVDATRIHGTAHAYWISLSGESGKQHYFILKVGNEICPRNSPIHSLFITINFG